MKKLKSYKLKQVLNNHAAFIENVSYISILHIFNMLVPLITYPYLIRVLGADNYGMVVYAQAVIGYFSIVVGFGFNISATKDISINRDDVSKVSEIVSSVYILKGLLLLIVIIFFVIIFFLFFENTDYYMLFLISFYGCFYEWLNPIWYFQGKEKMKYNTYLNLISRSIFLILIFILIKSKSDFLYVPLIHAIGSLTASCISIYLIFMKDRVKFIIPPMQILREAFFNSFPIFSSNVSLKLYLSSNKVIIGSFLGSQEVAYYDLGEKLLNLLKIPITILSQALFPKMSLDYKRSFLLKIGGIIVLTTTFFTGIVYSYLDEVILFLGGSEMTASSNVVRVLLISIIPLTISNLLGVQTLLAKGFNKQFLYVVLTSVVFYIIYIIFCSISDNVTLLNICWSYFLV